MKHKLTLAIALLTAASMLAPAAAQSSVGGPKKQTYLGGPIVQKNPVVPTHPGAASTPASSSAKKGPAKK